jgi:hypothetical protein
VSSPDRTPGSSALGLRPRPEPDTEVVAVVTAAIEQLSRRSSPVAEASGSLAWKHSGRWFAGHQVRLRGRPF